jgi:hypothetical protein
VTLNNFRIDLENSAGVKQGGGPITSASSWHYTARLDEAGEFSFTMPASDPKAAAVQKKRIARAYALLGSAWVEVGAGIVDHIERQPQDDGSVLLNVSGNDLIRELTYRSVLNLKLYLGGNPVTHAQALTAVSGFAPSGWTFTADSSPPNNSVYGYFNGETVLQGMIKIAEKSQSHFYRGAGRSLIFASTFTASGVRAVQARGDLSSATCAITSLSETVELYDLFTRIYPRGSGNAEAQLTLKASSRATPSGFVVDKNANYIEATAPTATYGRIERQLDFRDIGPVANTNGDIIAAANMLFDSALETLKRNSSELDQATYTLALAGCSQLLRPMQTIRIVYRDLASGLDINRDLNILESTWEVGEAGVYTTGLTVSTADKLPNDDQGTVVDTIANGKVYQALPQLNANSYVTAYKANIDFDHIGSFRFRLGNEVTQLQQVLFEFQLLPFESTVKSVGGSSGGSGSLPTTGPNTDQSGASTGTNNTSGAPSVANSGAPSVTNSGVPSVTNSGAASGDTGAASGANNNSGGPSVTNTGAVTGNTSAASGNTAAATGSTDVPSVSNTGTAPGNTGVTGSSSGNAIGNTGAVAGDTGAVVGNTSAATGNTSAASGNSGPSSGSTGATAGSADPASGNTGGSGSQQSDSPQGGDTTTGGKHQHNIHILAGAGNTGNVTLHHLGGGVYALSAGLAPDTVDIVTLESGSHTHTLGDHTHTLASHTHTLGNHTHDLNAHNHDLGSHTHSLNSHTHSLNNHFHDLGNHSHSLNNHFHSLGGHNHDLNNHTHDLGNHSHSLNSHQHGLGGHNHDLGNHTHTLGGHSHDLGAHTHDLGGHVHSLGNHTHTLNSHTHDLGAHTHSLNAHTHSLSNHTHSLAESITALYGIFRESAANTFLITELQYRVNGGSWFALNTAVSAGGSWWQLDITALVIDANTLRPAQDNNLLEIGSASVADKRVSVDAQLSIRNVIQAIAYN